MNAQLLARTGLVYVSDNLPGISRRRAGRGFSYRLPDGATLRCPNERRRINGLAIPPAYHDVWICPEDNGHIQATGYDARGRKQYRYHQEWQAFRSTEKFAHLIEFAEVLPAMRRRVRRDLEAGVGELEYTLAALVTLLDEIHLRAGNPNYVRENGSYGATTLLKRHVKLSDNGIHLNFIAKSGKRVRRQLRNPRLHKILEKIADLPGRELFTWMDEEGAARPVDSGRLNAYIAEISSGADISAKTFRTWAGSVIAFADASRALKDGAEPTVKSMTEAAAEALNNTPAVCRSSYIHPAIISLAGNEGPPHDNVADLIDKCPSVSGLRADEGRLLAFLKRFGDAR